MCNRSHILMNGMLSNGFLVKIPKESFLHCVECRQCTSAESESCCRLSCWQRSEVKQTMQRWPFQRGSRLCRWCVLELHNALAWARKWHIPQTDPPLSPGPLWPKQLHEKNWVFWVNILRHSTTEILEMRRNMRVFDYFRHRPLWHNTLLWFVTVRLHITIASRPNRLWSPTYGVPRLVSSQIVSSGSSSLFLGDIWHHWEDA